MVLSENLVGGLLHRWKRDRPPSPSSSSKLRTSKRSKNTVSPARLLLHPFQRPKTGSKLAGSEKPFNRVEHHDALVESYEKTLQECVDVGAKQIICFSGNRKGMDDEQGLENCAIGLQRIMPTAEKLGITVTMELLNSKVNHPDYMCDHSQVGHRTHRESRQPKF